MEETKIVTPQDETKIVSPQIKGLIIALIIIIVGIAGYYSGLAFESWFNWVANGIFFLAIIFACIHFANQKQGYVTFGNVFMHGFKATLVTTVIMLVYSVLAITVLFPEMKEKIFEMQQAEMEKRDMPEEQVETAMNMMRKYFTVFMILGVVFGHLIIGCIASLLRGAFAKKNKVDPFSQLSR